MNGSKDYILKEILNNYDLNQEESNFVSQILSNELNFDRLKSILTVIIDYKLGKDAVLAFLYYQLYKIFIMVYFANIN